MSGETHTCVGCGKGYSFSTSEKARFEALMKTVAGFQMPKRCFECRKERRNEGPRPPGPFQASAGSQGRSQAPRPPAAAPALAPPKKGEVRLVLATTDFENLISGRAVTWQGVTVVLADIGYKAMRDAIDRVEQDKVDAKFNR